jgi:hypothetical protein
VKKEKSIEKWCHYVDVLFSCEDALILTVVVHIQIMKIYLNIRWRRIEQIFVIVKQWWCF